jgi:hypothetical protein
MNVEEEDLSWKAKGIFLYLLSRPPGLIIRVTDLLNRSTDGKASLYEGLKELIKKKYVHRHPIYENGKIKVWNYLVFEEPPKNIETFLLSDFQEVENLEVENRDTYYYNSSNRQQNKTLSKDKDGRDRKSRLTEKTFLLRIKPRQPRNNNGLLYDSNKEPNKRIDLSKWLDHHNINKYDDREKEIHRLQTSLFAKQINPATEQIKEVLDYWNKIAFEMRNNGHKLPSHQIKDTKTIYMCQLIITGILHTSTITVEDFKKAIDNYSWILENSPWYNKIYPFPKFFSNRKLFDDCITGDIKENRRYVSQKKKTTKEGLLRIAEDEHRLLHGRKATYDEIQLYKRWIHEGEVTTEDEAKKCAR